jgi:hypothetical protein
MTKRQTANAKRNEAKYGAIEPRRYQRYESGKWIGLEKIWTKSDLPNTYKLTLVEFAK